MNAEHPVLTLERRRCEALEAGDIEAVAALLAADLVYVHATGLVHDREACLDYLRRSVRFEQVRRQALRVTEHGGVCWVTGELNLIGIRLPGGERFHADSYASQVWRCAATTWELVLFQSTRLPG